MNFDYLIDPNKAHPSNNRPLNSFCRIDEIVFQFSSFGLYSNGLASAFNRDNLHSKQIFVY